MNASLQFLENCKNYFMADRTKLRDEIQKNVFSNISEHLFLTFQSVYGKLKLALNQEYIINAQNQTPVVAYLFSQKGTGS